MDVTAIGRTRILYNTIRELVKAGHKVERIVTSEGADFYRNDIEDFRTLADELDAAFIHPDDINDPEMISVFQRSDSTVAVSVNWPTILEESVLEAFEHGVLNGHAGDLPRYRGNAAPNWAIINGETEVVLSVHRMTTELDAGPIFCQRAIPVTEKTYLKEIYEAMWEDFPELFVEALSGLSDGTIDPRPQQDGEKEVLRGYPRVPADSRIDWTASAQHLDRLVRASAEPLFGAFTYIDTEKLTIWRAHAESPAHDYLGTPGQVAQIRPETEEVAVVTGEDFLILEEVQFENGQRVPATDAITSVRTRLGMDLQETIRELKQRVSTLEESINGRIR